MAKRLELAGEVAWIKFLNGLPVRDPVREAAVLDAVTAQAATRGLNPNQVRSFFAAQIAASCAQQEKLIHLWSRGAPLPAYAPRSLQTDVRRDIDSANRAILDALAANPPLTPTLRARAKRSLLAHGICWQATQLATAPL
jgi:chorismate mutase